MNLKLARKLHLWLGLVFAPSILFFSLSGLFQICGLHEEGDHPWIAELALIHKDQMLSAPRREPRPPAAAPAGEPGPGSTEPTTHGPPRERPHASAPLKVFFFAMALGLIASTVLGILMAFGYRRDRRLVLGLLAAGIVLPGIALFL